MSTPSINNRKVHIGPIFKESPIKEQKNFLSKIFDLILSLFRFFGGGSAKPMQERNVDTTTENLSPGDRATKNTVHTSTRQLLSSPPTVTLVVEQPKLNRASIKEAIGLLQIHNGNISPLEPKHITEQLIQQHEAYLTQLTNDTKGNTPRDLMRLTPVLNEYRKNINQLKNKFITKQETKILGDDALKMLKATQLPKLRDGSLNRKELDSALSMLTSLKQLNKDLKEFKLEGTLTEPINEIEILIKAHEHAISLRNLNSVLEKETTLKPEERKLDKDILKKIETQLNNFDEKYQETAAKILQQPIQTYLTHLDRIHKLNV